MNKVVSTILDHKIIAILRHIPVEHMSKVLHALYEGGIRAAEITLNSEDALRSIKLAVEQTPDDMVIGAGTVMNVGQARAAIQSGARFLISPHLDISIIDTALQLGITPIPGVMTSTEIVQALNANAPLLKIFPCSSLGPSYIKEVRAPLSNAMLIAVGGVNVNNIRQYLEAGAVAVGVGSGLITKEALKAMDWGRIRNESQNLVVQANN